MSTLSQQDAADAVAQVEPEKKKAEPRAYVVLQKDPTHAASPSGATASATFTFVRQVEANSVEQAVREAAALVLATSDNATVTLVAVPARNFQPITVTSEVKTSLKLG